MGQRDDRYTLEGMIQADEGYYTVEASACKHKTQKAIRGYKTKNNVMAIAESTILEDIDTDKVERQARCFNKYLQLYLNEFIYKLKKRYFGERIFYRLVTASITANGH